MAVSAFFRESQQAIETVANEFISNAESESHVDLKIRIHFMPILKDTLTMDKLKIMILAIVR